MKPVTKVGLRLNADKTAILTNEAQLPNTLVTKDGLILKVLERNQGQNWAEYILTACGSMMPPHGFRLPHGKKNVNVNVWTPCGGPVLGAGGEPKENYIYKSVLTNRCTSGHAEGVEGVRKRQPCYFVPCTVQPMSQLFITAKSFDLLIPRVPWPTYLSSSDGWIPSQHPTYPAMFRQVCHIAKQVPMLLTYDP